jgi:aminoglycoside 6'-N-acetyltransferase
LLAGWLARPHVEQWWREEHDLGAVEKRYAPCIDGRDPTEVFIVEVEGRPVGMVQRYLLDDEPGWKTSLAPSGAHDSAAGIDYLLGEEAATGHGLGPVMIAAFVEPTWARYPQVTEIVASVAQENRRSWRALEKAGFARTWSGEIVSDDPSDEGPSYVYSLGRPRPPS